MAVYSRFASPSSTLAVLKANGLVTRRSLGQHFLVDDNIVGRILRLADILDSETVLEIGPGIGTLTVALCDKAGSVVAVECDDRLIPILEKIAAECGNLEVVHADATRVDVGQVSSSFGPPAGLVANLPYSVAATLILDLFQCLPSLDRAIVMVQAEVADRICASPGSKQYGAYTVKLGYFAKASERFPVPRTCFLPPPRVDSAVIRLERQKSEHSLTELRMVSEVVDVTFAHRRKTLRNSLRTALPTDSGSVDEALHAAGIDGSLRAEALNGEDFVVLARCLAQYGLLP